MDDMMQQQMEEQQLRDQRLMNESSQWITDPVHRDMMWGDRKRKPYTKKYSQRTSLIVFLIAVLLMAGAILTFVYAQKPTSSEIYQQELIKQLHTDSLGNTSDSYKAFENMNQEMDRVIQKEEEHRQTWIYILSICAIAPLAFVIYMIVAYFKNKDYRPTWREVLLTAGVTVVTAALLYVVDVFFFYMRFYAEDNMRKAFIVLIVFFGLGWIVYQLRKTKK